MGLERDGDERRSDSINSVLQLLVSSEPLNRSLLLFPVFVHTQSPLPGRRLTPSPTDFPPHPLRPRDDLGEAGTGWLFLLSRETHSITGGSPRVTLRSV